jgi:hypothetical protein
LLEEARGRRDREAVDFAGVRGPHGSRYSPRN